MATPTLFTAREVAPQIRRHYLTVLRYAREGKLHGIKLNGGYLFSEQDIADFLASGHITQPASKPAAPRRARHPKYDRISK